MPNNESTASVHDINDAGKNKDASKKDDTKKTNILVEAFDRQTCVELLRITAFTAACMGAMVLAARILGGGAPKAQQ